MSYTNHIRAEEKCVRVLSSNVLAAQSDSDTLIPKRYRAKALCAHYIAYAPDFIGLQEVQPDSMPIFTEGLAEFYTAVDVDTNGEKNFTPLFYKTAEFDLLASKYETFIKKGMWHYEWALYRRKRDGKRVIHMNLHYHFSVTEQRLPEARLVNAELKRLMALYPDAAIFVTGDYNCETFTPEFEAMVEGIAMRSGMHLTEDNDGYEVGWHHPDTADYVGPGAIDHVCVTCERARVLRHRRLKSELLQYTTDHDPVFVDAELL